MLDFACMGNKKENKNQKKRGKADKSPAADSDFPLLTKMADSVVPFCIQSVL